MNITIQILKYFSIAAILSLSLNCCASSDLKVSEFKFNYNNKDYLVRSAYCPDDPSSCNQLIGEDFVAVDMNQDRIIDKIRKGSISLEEAQEIYDYSLNLLKEQNKLNEVSRREKKFTVRENFFNYEITTLYPEIGKEFNEFRIIDKNNATGFYQASIFLDENADGILEKRLKGTIPLENAQNTYEKIIEKGIYTGELIKTGSSITVN